VRSSVDLHLRVKFLTPIGYRSAVPSEKGGDEGPMQFIAERNLYTNYSVSEKE